MRNAALHCAPTIGCTILRSYNTLRYTALLFDTLRYTALPRHCAALRSYDTLRYTAFLRLTALHCAPLRFSALLCATLRYSALLRAILGYPTLSSTLFYFINCKLTAGRMDVKTNEGCGVPATYSK